MSFGPPLGGVVVFAHEGEKINIPVAAMTAARGRYWYIVRFILFLFPFSFARVALPSKVVPKGLF